MRKQYINDSDLSKLCQRRCAVPASVVGCPRQHPMLSDMLLDMLLDVLSDMLLNKLSDTSS